MTTLARPLAVNDTFPALALITPTEQRTTWAQVRSPGSTVVYFMRTSTCPVCHHHVRQLGSARVDGAPLGARTVIVVPGGAAEAAAVEQRHPTLAGRIFASDDAHARVGLFVKMGLQQSGNFVVDPHETVTYAKWAAIPLGTFAEHETIAALSYLQQ